MNFIVIILLTIVYAIVGVYLETNGIITNPAIFAHYGLMFGILIGALIQ